MYTLRPLEVNDAELVVWLTSLQLLFGLLWWELKTGEVILLSVIAP